MVVQEIFFRRDLAMYGNTCSSIEIKSNDNLKMELNT